MGATRRFSQRIALGKSKPAPSLSSSGFWLSQPNVRYISWVDAAVYLTINLRNTSGRFLVEWYNPLMAITKTAAPISGGDFIVLKPPFKTESVLFLNKKI